MCFWAWKAVGTYGRGLTLGLSKKVRRSVSTIEDWAHAYDTYHRLGERLPGARAVLRQLRRDLPYTYWGIMWRLSRRHSLDEESMLEYLIEARDGDLTSGDMAGGIEHHEWVPAQGELEAIAFSDAVSADEEGPIFATDGTPSRFGPDTAPEDVLSATVVHVCGYAGLPSSQFVIGFDHELTLTPGDHLKVLVIGSDGRDGS